MRKGVITTGIISIVLGVIYLIQSLQYEMGTMDRPGPGFYPVFVAAFLIIGAIGTILSAIIHPPEGVINWPIKAERWRVLGVIAVSFFYAFTLRFVGFLICGAIVTFVCLHVMGMRSWPLKIGVTVIVTIASFLVFDKLLSIPLPRGIISF